MDIRPVLPLQLQYAQRNMNIVQIINCIQTGCICIPDANRFLFSFLLTLEPRFTN